MFSFALGVVVFVFCVGFSLLSPDRAYAGAELDAIQRLEAKIADLEKSLKNTVDATKYAKVTDKDVEARAQEVGFAVQKEIDVKKEMMKTNEGKMRMFDWMEANMKTKTAEELKEFLDIASTRTSTPSPSMVLLASIASVVLFIFTIKYRKRHPSLPEE